MSKIDISEFIENTRNSISDIQDELDNIIDELNDIPELINIYNCDYAFYIILCTGDKLSNWFYDNNIKPSEVINNEELFNKFINEPFTLPLTM